MSGIKSEELTLVSPGVDDLVKGDALSPVHEICEVDRSAAHPQNGVYEIV